MTASLPLGRRALVHALLAGVLALGAIEAPSASAVGRAESVVEMDRGERDERARPRVAGWDLPSTAPLALEPWSPSLAVPRRSAPELAPSAVVAHVRARRSITRPRIRRPGRADPDDH